MGDPVFIFLGPDPRAAEFERQQQEWTERLLQSLRIPKEMIVGVGDPTYNTITAQVSLDVHRSH
jgi:hypothetical protein